MHIFAQEATRFLADHKWEMQTEFYILPTDLGSYWSALGIKLPPFGLPSAILWHNCCCGLNSTGEVSINKVTFFIFQSLVDIFRSHLDLLTRSNEHLNPVSRQWRFCLLSFSGMIFLSHQYHSNNQLHQHRWLCQLIPWELGWMKS